MITKVQEERIEKLCVRLESEADEQGQNYLRQVTPDGRVKMCCLGVATDQAIKDGLTGVSVSSCISSDGTEITMYNGNGLNLCREVQDYYGFGDENPTLLIGYSRRPAAILNDGDDTRPPQPFPVIAKAFRETFLK